jgi:hypothetical protein
VPGAGAGDPARPVVLVREGVEKPRRVANLSARGLASSNGAEMIAGFVIVGGDAQVLLRAVGPGLAQFDVTGFLPQLRIDLFRGSTFLEGNDGWSGAPNAAALAAAAAQVGAFPLREIDADAALLPTLPALPFTAVVSAPSGARGIVLAEAYDTSPDDARSPLTNISARAWVGLGDDVLIAGFVIAGEVPQLVLVRAVGPGLASYGVAGFLADPELEIHHGGAVIAQNDNWSASPDAARLASVGAAAGAFPLSAGARDAAALVYLPPGVYSAVVRGVGATEGVALAEVYRVSEPP